MTGAFFTATVLAIPASGIAAIVTGEWRWLLVTAVCIAAIRVGRR